MKSIWDEKPLKDLDLLKEVEKRQSKNRWLTKMDIFRALSKKYKNILTPDQFNFRYNYLIDKKKKLAIKHITNLPPIVNDDITICKNQEVVEVKFKPYNFIISEFRDDKQQLLNVNQALYNMIDNKKLVKFCDKQLQLQKKRKASGGLSIIFKRLAELFNQKESTISSRYYLAKKNLNKENSKIDVLNGELSRHLGTIVMLEDKISTQEKQNTSLEESYNSLMKNYRVLENESKDTLLTLNKLKQKPLVKLSLLIDNVINSIKEGII